MSEWAFVFDLDDTLYLERDYVRSGFQAADEWARGHGMGEGFYLECCRLFDAGIRDRVFDEALRWLGRPIPVDLAESLVRVYRGHTPRIELALDARVAIAALRPHGPLALITDGPPECQRNKIRALGLAGWLDKIVVTDELGVEYRKPHRRPFEVIERALYGVRRFVYVGDNPAKDFETPAAMGWKTVRIRRPTGLHAAAKSVPVSAEILSLEELPALLGVGSLCEVAG